MVGFELASLGTLASHINFQRPFHIRAHLQSSNDQFSRACIQKSLSFFPIKLSSTFEINQNMEHLEVAKTIRLKTQNGKYLVASNDEKSICQNRDGSTGNALWSVELLDGQHYLRLKSCYGKYLTASNVPLIPKVTGSRKVLQTLPERLCSATEWEAEHDGSLHQVRLKTRYGHFLRPSGGIPPWRNIVTHDVPRRRKATLWEIEIMETHKAIKKVQPAPSNFVQFTKPFTCTFTEPI